MNTCDKCKALNPRQGKLGLYTVDLCTKCINLFHLHLLTNHQDAYFKQEELLADIEALAASARCSDSKTIDVREKYRNLMLELTAAKNALFLIADTWITGRGHKK